MSPAQFLSRLKKQEVPPVCLFLGAEAYARRRCREAVLEAHLGPESSEARVSGFTQYDLSEISLPNLIDDARAMSLFAPSRVIVAISAEGALPRSGRSAESEGDDEPASTAASGDALAAYVTDPTPGVVLILEATRFELEGEDKKKTDRIRKFYGSVRDVVEFPKYSSDDARAELLGIARRLKLSIDAPAAAMLVDALAADVSRIATELEKLSLFAGDGSPITEQDIAALVPDARESTIFSLVNALGRRDRARALVALDSLCRAGEYLPLALAFLSTQFRLALASHRAGLRSASQVQGFFVKNGVPMWPSRAEQVAQTLQRFTSTQLESGLKLIFNADRDLRSSRPDDRIVMEQFVLNLTA